MHVYRFDTDVNTQGRARVRHGALERATLLPKGTLYMPMAQPLKHWIQAVMGEDPFQPLEFFYDVAQWSYPLHRGLAGDGFLTSQLPAGVPMTEIDDPALGSVAGAGKPVLRVRDGLDAGARAGDASCSTRASRWPAARRPRSRAGGHFVQTGAALVDGLARSAGVDLAALAAKRADAGDRRSTATPSPTTR